MSSAEQNGAHGHHRGRRGGRGRGGRNNRGGRGGLAKQETGTNTGDSLADKQASLRGQRGGRGRGGRGQGSRGQGSRGRGGRINRGGRGGTAKADTRVDAKEISTNAQAPLIEQTVSSLSSMTITDNTEASTVDVQGANKTWAAVVASGVAAPTTKGGSDGRRMRAQSTGTRTKYLPPVSQNSSNAGTSSIGSQIIPGTGIIQGGLAAEETPLNLSPVGHQAAAGLEIDVKAQDCKVEVLNDKVCNQDKGIKSDDESADSEKESTGRDNDSTGTTPEDELEAERISYRRKAVLSEKQAIQVRRGLEDLHELRRTMALRAAVTYVVVDIEWWEVATTPKKCTEVGAAILHKPANGVAKFKKCTHFVIRENYYRRNRRWVPDHKDDFNEEFGVSTPIKLERLGAAIHSIIRDAKSKGETLLVVHGGKEDMEWLNSWECDISGLKVLDTQSIAQALYFETNGFFYNPPGLEKVLSCYGIVPKNLHNGGNDACYTMQALQAMAAVKEGEYGLRDVPDPIPYSPYDSYY